MSDRPSPQAGLPTAFPGLLAGWVLRAVVPAERREEFLGDLIEEAETFVLADHGREAARHWVWRQIIASVGPLLARRWAKEVSMNWQRWIVAAVILLGGSAMAWDSGVYGAPAGVIAMVTVAVLVPALSGLLSGHYRVYVGAAVASGLLLSIARLWSGIEIRWYAMAFLFLVVLMMSWMYEHGTWRVSGGPSGPTVAT